MLDRLLKLLFFAISFGLMVFIVLILSGCGGTAPYSRQSNETSRWEEACQRSGGVVWCERQDCQCVSKDSARDAMARIFL